MIETPYTISLYKGDSLWHGDAGNWLGDIYAVQSLDMMLRHNATSTASIKASIADPNAALLMQDGVRIKIWRGSELLFTGVQNIVTVNGPSFKGTITAQFNSDFGLLHDLVSLPWTGGGSQTDSKLYWKMTGAAETVAKALISQNAARVPYVYVAADGGKGASMTVSTRLEELYNALYPQVDNSDIGIKVYHDGTRLVVDTYEVTDYGTVLDEASGIVTDWSLSTASPTANVVYSGANYNQPSTTTTDANGNTTTTSTPDKFEFVTATDADSKAVWGQRESYRPANGGKSDVESSVIAAANAEAAAGLKELKAKNGVSVKLAANGALLYGSQSGFVIGKRVTISLQGVTRTDILREVHFTFSAETGDQTTPVVGEIANDPSSNVTAFLASVKKGIKRLEAGNS